MLILQFPCLELMFEINNIPRFCAQGPFKILEMAPFSDFQELIS
jgi:hypothetical protein